MRYDFNQIGDPHRFQRLVNGILTARFGEDARLTPLQGPDGGSDGETAPSNPNMEFRRGKVPPEATDPFVQPPRPGGYLFQAKYHPTGEQRLSDLRTRVVGEFEHELQHAVLHRPARRDVNYFFLVTNLSASKHAQRKVDEVRKRLIDPGRDLHADIWWSERLTTFLDWSPRLWSAFPELFPGHVVPSLAAASSPSPDGLPRTFRAALSAQYQRHRTVKFRQIELEQQLLDLFVDLDLEFPSQATQPFVTRPDDPTQLTPSTPPRDLPESALEFLLDDTLAPAKVLLEGGPGQGKSTITQMAAQIYREKVLGIFDSTTRNPNWHKLCRPRLPIYLELGPCAHWLSQTPDRTLEEYIAHTVGRDSGGAPLTVADLQQFLCDNPAILLLDGLDEVGSDSLRNRLLDAIGDTIQRFEQGLRVDLRVVLTSRPPALTGRRARLTGFFRVLLTSMKAPRISEYLDRWLSVRIKDQVDRDRITASFERRKRDPHVEALARNPMQLSVLLHLIHLKGEAFPDRRAELYGTYFQMVIDRDVEKSPELREYRDLVEGLHSFLGFHLHGVMEIERGHPAFSRSRLIELSSNWLDREGYRKDVAEKYFALGEERFGLIVALSGEGADTTYGFEVQPIQEYFAAFYISNRLPAHRAHEVFELLVYRSYWREVALFLAGLRRPNEKADLVARAKVADGRLDEGRQKAGRTMILQLLREGVLDQARHVVAEAMQAVVELLKVEILRFQRNPEPLVETVCQLAERYELGPMSRRIVDIVRRCSASEEEDLLAIIHGMAARLLAHDHYKALVLGYSGTKPLARSVVLMGCPYAASPVLEELAAAKDYWSRVPMPVWARCFWRSARKHGYVIDMDCPPELHQGLIAEFATDQFELRDSGAGVLAIPGGRPDGIWRLQQNLDVIHQHLRQGVSGHDGRSESVLGAQGSSGVDWRGCDASYSSLDGDVGGCVGDLVRSSDRVVVALLDGGGRRFATAIGGHLEAIREHLGDAGLSGWVACRCGGEVLRLLEFSREGIDREAMHRVADGVGRFYGVERGKRSGARDLHGLRMGPPMAVRVERGGTVVPLQVIIRDILAGRGGVLDDSWAWINYVPLNSMAIRPLVEACRDNLGELLGFVGRRPVVGVWPQTELASEDVDSILEICRGTDDEEVLGGAGMVLWTSGAAYISEPELLVKMVAAAPASPLSWALFNPMGGYVPKPEERQRRQDVSRTVAGIVVSDADGYGFGLVNRASNFLAESEGVVGTPLFEECPDLVIAT